MALPGDLTELDINVILNAASQTLNDPVLSDRLAEEHNIAPDYVAYVASNLPRFCEGIYKELINEEAIAQDTEEGFLYPSKHTSLNNDQSLTPFHDDGVEGYDEYEP